MLQHSCLEKKTAKPQTPYKQYVFFKLLVFLFFIFAEGGDFNSDFTEKHKPLKCISKPFAVIVRPSPIPSSVGIAAVNVLAPQTVEQKQRL